MFTDQQLAARVKRGEDWAFEELAARHADIIDHRCALRYHASEEADDFRQAALVGLFKAARTFAPVHGCPFPAWARICVQSELDTFLVTASREKHNVLSDADRFERRTEDGGAVGDGVAAPANAEPCARVIAREELQRAVEVIVGCTTTERTVVRRRLNGLTPLEAGDGLGRGKDPAKTADNAFQRIRRKLAAAA
ncbi:MAG TPA: sigma factor [Solirubrobacteraceae bacterium]